jgi:hypothetical protein
MTLRALGDGPVRKMQIRPGAPAEYVLPLGDGLVPMNALIGREIRLDYRGRVSCCHCGRTGGAAKFRRGYCYPCFRSLAQCDTCIMSPERCHYDRGTCREPEWALVHCMRDHFVYLANSSSIKVGITRCTQTPIRWLDQGAVQAMPILRVKTRQQAGLAEVIFKKHVTDRTNWRRMLQPVEPVADLVGTWSSLRRECAAELAALAERFGAGAIELLKDVSVFEAHYPVVSYPEKVVSHNLEKEGVVRGRLTGIKGQYLLLDTGVINVRKYTAYHVELSA